MPRYTFQTIERDHQEEEFGVGLADDQAARVMAVRAAGSIVADMDDGFADGGQFEMRVTKDDGTHVGEITIVAKPIF